MERSKRVFDIMVDGIAGGRVPAGNRTALEVQHYLATDEESTDLGHFVRVVEKCLKAHKHREV